MKNVTNNLIRLTLLAAGLALIAGCQSRVVREYSEDTTTIISSEQTVGGVPAGTGSP
ncbi:MAG: hypothetical protein SynsKO_28730 [Synoicihabitans sp.]